MSDEFTPTPPMEEGGGPGEAGTDEASRHQEVAQEVQARQAAERAEATQTGAQDEADVASATESGQPVTSVGPQQRPDLPAGGQEQTEQEEAAAGQDE